jgi:RNA polymerase sigma-70 factor (ECF subfamily)
MEAQSEPLTELLQAWQAGRHDAVEKLLPQVYSELRRLSRSYLRRERPEHTLQTTALINEAYLRVAGQGRPWQNRDHFFGVIAQIMRQVLIDHARARRAEKRGGPDVTFMPLDELRVPAAERPLGVMDLDEALLALSELDPRQGEIVELRFFVGFTNQQVARTLGISVPTVEREWRTAKLWLRRYLDR